MKKIVLIAACFITTSALCQKLNQAAVPGQVKKVFSRIYPNTKATWEKEEGNYEATFSRAGKKMATVINDNGNILETESAIRPTELP